MVESRGSEPGGASAPEALLRELDPLLNVFALANGLDLHKDLTDPPARLLGWYRDGMERFLRLEAEADGSPRFALWAEALETRQGRSRRGRRALEQGVGGEALLRDARGMLERGIEEANALGSSDLAPEGHDPA